MRGEHVALMLAQPEDVRRMAGYVGSIAFSGNGTSIAATSPRGGLLQLYDTVSGNLAMVTPLSDVSGVAMIDDSFIVSSGTGEMRKIGLQAPVRTGTIEFGFGQSSDPCLTNKHARNSTARFT